MLFWSWINLLLFSLHNQRHEDAIAEDKINKPWRPLPAKRLTPSEATAWMYVTYPLVIGSSLALGGKWPCWIHAVFCLWYNEWKGAEYTVLKNFINAAGIACFLAGPFEIAVTGGSSLWNYPEAFNWPTIIGAVIFSTSHTQDFRDQEGDKLRNRRTVPLAIGDGLA